MSDPIPPFGVPPYPPGPVPPAGDFPSPAAPVPAPPVVPPTASTPPVAVRRRGPGVLGTVLIAALVAAVVGGFAGLAGYVVGRGIDDGRSASTTTGTPVVIPQSNAGGTSPVANGSIADIAATTLPAVVSILAEGSTQSGSGSGFIVRPNGYILTNNHVVDLVVDGGDLTVVFNDGSRAKGKVVGTSASYDLAVVKVDRSNLPTVTLGNSSSVHVGDTAIAIGAPLGLDGTVTSGIISALDRPVTAGDAATEDPSFINAIQTDAAINPGNSGGPLLDGSGTVIGVNSAIASLAAGLTGEAGNIGLGFAIPINSAKRIAEELIATGTSRTPRIGVNLDTSYTDAGAKIKDVTAGSPAEDAGLRSGDVIVTVEGRSIDDATELVVEIRNHAPGDTIAIGYTRGGQDRTASLVLGDDSATN
ncbi:MAG: trypsin-like peptidase domain-containing protein [Actinobacteria bacterium]|nr:trypsin-like peptidase domain-containing protein [Actinomycetota bacterium]